MLNYARIYMFLLQFLPLDMLQVSNLEPSCVNQRGYL